METTDQKSRTTSPDIPKVPIKTYCWEDVRRSRKRGEYPWTHLTKPPFDEEIDPEEYTMDAFRRSRSTSTIGKSETQEVTAIEDDAQSNNKSEYLENQTDKENVDVINIPAPSSSTKNLELLPKGQSNGNKDRAKSEEPHKKRKLSIESSYSRISLPKLQIMDKLKSAKNKFKVPKLSKRSRSDASGLEETKKQKIDTTTSSKGKQVKMQTIKDNSPVYIHIPLKPPPGETDEFSKYEFEDVSHSPSGSLKNVALSIDKKRKTSLLDILTQIKVAHDQHVARRASQTSVDLKKTIKLKPDSDSDLNIQELTEEHQLEIKEEDDFISEPPTIEIEESGSTIQTELQESTQSDKLTIEEIRDSEKSEEDDKSELEIVPTSKTLETNTLETEESSVDDNISQYLDKDDKYEVIHEVGEPSATKTQEQTQYSSDPEKVRKLEATLSKWKKQIPKAEKLEPTTREILPQRARSEEPKRKRKSSIDSSYSRKSLSKLAFIKKIKQAKEKIKLPNFPSFSKFDKSKLKLSKEKKPMVERSVEKSKRLQPAHPEKPVYIHIPLKLPPGERDEFSHLENEQRQETQLEKMEVTERVEPDTPDTEISEINVQLIILTPPSDDEILDSAGPETPCETDKKFFESLKIEDLKTLAKNAVETVYPDSKLLETVKEDDDIEDVTDDQVDEHLNKEEDLLPPTHQHILVDEEDGLKLSDAAIAMINEELEKEYNQQALGLKSIIKSESSPVLKKKVSFKRKSKIENGARVYEDVQLNKGISKSAEDNVVAHSVIIPLESFQSMSVDEEKSYLDKELIKTTSLEDDYNKWSKINDHEYEPINPPPEVITIQGPPVIHDKTSSLGRNVQASDEYKFDHHEDEHLTVHELARNLEDRYFPDKQTKTGTIESISTKLEVKDNQKQSSKGSTKEGSKASTSSKGSVKSKRRSQPISKSFNDTLRTQAVKIKNKLQGIKKPNIAFPSPPKLPTAKLQKPSFKKPSFKLPKLPDRHAINLPSLNFMRKDSKDSWRTRQFSTESNAGDSKKKIFDFRTYPRMFDKSRRKDGGSSSENREPSPSRPEFATVPRAGKAKASLAAKWTNVVNEISNKKDAQEDASKTVSNPDVIRISLHSEESMDPPSNDEFETNFDEGCNLENLESEPRNVDFHGNREELVREDHGEELDEYVPDGREEGSPFGKDLLKRWEHGEFHEGPQILNKHHIQDIHNVDYLPDQEDVQTPREGSEELTPPPQDHSSGSLSEHHRGVLEEIDSDEFFLREKGISQEDIEVGKYLSSEIREAFRKPVSALPQSHSKDREYDLELSDQSEPVREPPRRKPLRKPKRKKTPHVSSEEISFDRESLNTEPEEYPKTFKEIDLQILPPIRPVRQRNLKKKNKSQNTHIIPYQETISVDADDQIDTFIHPDYTLTMDSQEILHNNILSGDLQYFYENDFPQMYENEHMRGIEQPEIKVSDPYYRYENFHTAHEPYFDDHPPIPPTRRQRSLRSLSASDQESIPEDAKLNEITPTQYVQRNMTNHEYIIPTPEPPIRPRRTRSRTRSVSASQIEDDRTSRGADSLVSDNPVEATEVFEIPCVKDIRDTSGYAVIDKTKSREPPLPPSRLPKTPPRTRRTKKKQSKNDKFATVPRLSSENGQPVRPLRNYSTLRGTTPSLNEDEKENLNVTDHLQSGEVIQKMRDRPLPAPPRPPRKSRLALRDVSHERNLPTNSQETLDKAVDVEDEAEIQALLQLEDQILPYDHEETVTHGSLILQTISDPNILPYSTLHTDDQSTVHFIAVTHDPTDDVSTVNNQSDNALKMIDTNGTHNKESEVIQANDDQFSEILQDFKDLRSAPQEPEDKDDDFSEIPEEFKQLKAPQTDENVTVKGVAQFGEDSEIPNDFEDLSSPTTVIGSGKIKSEELPKSKDSPIQQNYSERRSDFLCDEQEVSILRAQKLQVADLDVDKLRVNELQASKIIVSELDGISLQVSEINSKCGNLVVSGIDLPPNLIQEMLQKLQIATEERIALANIVQPSASEAKEKSVEATESNDARQKKNCD